MTLKEIRIALKKALDKAAALLVKEDTKNTRRWTADMLSAIIGVGNTLGFYTCATKRNAKKACYGSEWLFDACWLKYVGDSFRKVALVAECEWWAAKPVEHENDFAKLVVAKADLRLLVCEVKDEAKHKELIAWLKDYASDFNAANGDKYMVSCWITDEEKFRHIHFTASRHSRKRGYDGVKDV